LKKEKVGKGGKKSTTSETKNEREETGEGSAGEKLKRREAEH